MYETSRGAKVRDMRWTNCRVFVLRQVCILSAHLDAIRLRVRTAIDGFAERSCPGFKRCGGSER
jgi:hypothetical protein